MVAAVGETTGESALRNIRRRMTRTREGRLVLQEQPRVTSTSLALNELRQTAPVGSFGRAYVEFMDQRGFSPDERPLVRYVREPSLAYVMQRFREVHDFWHVLTGLDTTVQGELALKWFESVQTGLPVATMSAVVGPLRLTRPKRRVLLTRMVPWAIRCANNCEDLMSVYYEHHLEEDIDQLRQRLGFLPVPNWTTLTKGS